MQRVILVYGAIAGAVAIGSALLGIDLGLHSAWLGYLVMLIALSLIFVGIKQHRDRHLGGVIRFGTATLVGLAIAAVAGVVYVAVWEVYLAATDYAFMSEYAEGVIAAQQAQGVSGAELQAIVEEMDRMTAWYAKPAFRLPMTFLEIFPVGVLVTLVSAAILRNPGVLPARG